MNKENIITQIKKNSNEVYRISEKEYEGYRFIDVRIYYQDRKTQEWKPTTKGISIMPNNAEEIINGIIKAMEVMGFTKEKAWHCHFLFVALVMIETTHMTILGFQSLLKIIKKKLDIVINYD